jgi:hypothetical protein
MEFQVIYLNNNRKLPQVGRKWGVTCKSIFKILFNSSEYSGGILG